MSDTSIKTYDILLNKCPERAPYSKEEMNERNVSGWIEAAQRSGGVETKWD